MTIKGAEKAILNPDRQNITFRWRSQILMLELEPFSVFQLQACYVERLS